MGRWVRREISELINEIIRKKKILEEEKKNFIDRWVELKRRIRTETIPPKSMFGSNPKLPPFTEKDRVKFHDCLT